MSMIEAFERNGMKFATGTRTVMIFLSVLLSGCRLGNQVVQGPQANSISGIMDDTISGYYQSEIQDQLLCSNNSPTGGEICRSVPATTIPGHPIPQIPFQVMTQPLAVVMTDLDSGSGYLVGLGYSSNPPNLGVLVDTDKTIFYVGNTSATPAFYDTACTVQWVLETRGRLNLSSQNTQIGRYPISGRVEVDYNVVQIFDGNCAASLQAMQACYLSKSNCGGANDSENTTRYNAVVADFGDFIQAGTMSASDIPYVTKTAYHFAFQ